VADPLYSLLFEGLWVLADRAGKLEDRPLRIKGEVFPYREGLDMEAMLDWLHAHSFILRYQVGSKKYILVLEFVKHQNPHKNETESEIPDPEEIGTVSEIIGSTRADSLSSDSGFLIPDYPDPDKPAAPSTPKAKAEDRKTPIPADFQISERVRTWAEKGGYTRLDEHLDAFRRKCEANGYKKVNWDSAFMEAIREDWAKLRGRVANGSAPPADHASADELESRASIEKQGCEKGLGPWDCLKEQFPAYRERVLRAPRISGFSLDQLASRAPKQGATT